MIYLLLALAAIGHAVFWAAIVNRLHGLGIERRWIDVATALCGLALVGIPAAIGLVFWRDAAGGAEFSAAWGYLYGCAVFGLLAAAHRTWLVLHPERRGTLDSNHTTRVDWGQRDRVDLAAAGIPRLLAQVPGNQVFDLRLHEKHVTVPRLPAGRELRIVHISDLHMSGRIAKEYFVEMAAVANSMRPDLIMLTGDLVERDACLGWLPDTLGQLRAGAGVFYVLGNHDLHVDHRRLVRELGDLGLMHVGGTWREAIVGGLPIVIAGNELPWFGPAPRAAGLPPRETNGLPFRILLAHAPDQFAWAAAHDFDLVLAGHNHGGQVRLPLLGAILAPSLSGVRYASGAFRRDQTLMHVSRGTGSLTPFRWGCPPEIALLVLRSST